MEQEKIKTFFEHQVHTVIERAAADGQSFLAYFADHEPREEEILGLLAVSTLLSADFAPDSRFPTPVEALAALAPECRSDICRQFRHLLKNWFQKGAPV